MRIAIEGCLHGELDILYNTVKFIEQQHQTKIDLLIVCGDFQAVRNEADLKCLACPPKYRAMQQFWKYYKGQKRAPVLTIFIGGNHEASNHMQELPYGGWVAENIYYLGYCGIVEFGGVRIGGISGIFKGHDYNKGHFERPPYSDDTIRSAYHTRSIDTFRMKQVKLPLDIMISHDWPQGIYNYGDVDTLVRKKQHFKEQVEPGTRTPLGSPSHAELLYHLRPQYWFSAHLHVKWVCVVDHDKVNDADADLYEEQENLNTNRYTRFLALDKALPQRDFLQVVDIPTRQRQPYEFKYDPEWMAVLRNTNDLMSLTPAHIRLPVKGIDKDYDRSATQEDIEIIRADFDFNLRIPRNFRTTVDLYNPKEHWKKRPVELLRNPQNTEFCAKMGLVDPFTVFKEGRDPTKPMESLEENNIWSNPGEIQLDDNIEPENNPDEINLDEEDDDDCMAPPKEEIKPKEEEIKKENHDSDEDGAPQSRPFRLPFLPPPTKEPASGKNEPEMEQAAKPEVEEPVEQPVANVVNSGNKGFKRRNQAIYQDDQDDEN